jgi:DNA-directed RNA polymerase specialized sigma24 family protein
MTPEEKSLHSAMQSERRHLGSLAYRLLGTLVGAEDAIRTTYVQWYGLAPEEQDLVEAPRAWLTRAVAQVCFQTLTSAHGTHTSRQRHEAGGTHATAADELTPAERVAFVLHDGFAMSCNDIAEIVGETPETCRRLATAARRRQVASRAQHLAGAQRDAIVRDFISASRRGDEVEICEQATANGLGFALWDDGRLVAAAALDVVDGAILSSHFRSSSFSSGVASSQKDRRLSR